MQYDLLEILLKNAQPIAGYTIQTLASAFISALFLKGNTARTEFEKIKADYEAEIADAHSQAVEITNKAKAQAGRECDLMLENARAESAKIMKEAEKSIANEKEKAMDDAKYQIADLAILAAAKVIKKNVGGDSDRETVDEFLSEVGAAK